MPEGDPNPSRFQGRREHPFAQVTLRDWPAAIEAEQALLGACMANARGADLAIDAGLKPEHFAEPAHATLWRALCDLLGRGEAASAVTLAAALANSAALAAVGGPAYLARLLACHAGLPMVAAYAGAIVEAWRRRSLIEVAIEAAERGFAPPPDKPASAQIEWAQDALDAITRDAGQAGAMIEAPAALGALMAEMDAAAKRGDGLAGASTGYRYLDRYTSGLRAGKLYLLAARPSMGKSALALQIAARVAAGEARAGSGRAVLFASLEMTAVELMARLVGPAAEVPVERVEKGTLDAEEWHRVGRARETLAALPLVIDESAGLSPAMLRARARMLARRPGLALVVVDYVGLMSPPEEAMRYGSRVHEVSAISKALKALAMDLKVPVIALSQLNREAERRDDKRPQLADLRDSGSLEQDADAVLLLHRRHYYLTRSPPVQREKESDAEFHDRQAGWQKLVDRSAGRAQVIVAKMRGGRTGLIGLGWQPDYTLFEDLPEGTIEEDEDAIADG